MSALAPTLDRSGEPWVAAYPLLGTVRVASDGAFTVEVDPDAAEGAAEALEHVWAEPLSWVRRGLWVATATVMRDPQTGSGLMLMGYPKAIARMCLALLGAGWAIVSWSMTAVELGAGGRELVAHPRAGRPFVPSSVDPSLTRTRPGAVASTLDTAPWREPVPIAARLVVGYAGSPEIDRKGAAYSIANRIVETRQAGVSLSPAEVMAFDLASKDLPVAEIGSSESPALDAVLAWWAEVVS